MGEIRKVGILMMMLGALTVCSTICSIAFTVVLAWFKNLDFLPSVIASILTSFMVTVQTFFLNRYFNERLKKHELK